MEKNVLKWYMEGVGRGLTWPKNKNDINCQGLQRPNKKQQLWRTVLKDIWGLGGIGDDHWTRYLTSKMNYVYQQWWLDYNETLASFLKNFTVV